MRKGWDYKKLGEVAAYITDGDWIESKDQSDSGIRLIQTGNVGNGVFKLKDDKPHYISEETFSRIGCIEIFEGDCLISRLPDPIGRACVIPNIGCRMITAVDCSIIRFNDNYLPQFFVYYTQSSNYRIGINNYTTGSTRKRISRKNLENVSIPVPSLAEQQSIVSELDKIHELISLKKAQLSDLDTLAQSIFYEMFGDPIENEKGWVTERLDSITKSESGGTPSKLKPEYWNGNIIWVSSKDMKSTYISDSLIHITQEGVNNSPAHILPIGTILIVNRSGILKHTLPLAITTKEVTINQDIKALIVNSENVFDLYLLYCLKAFSPFLLSKVKAVTVDSIDFAIIKRLQIPLPPLPLQQSFARKIEAIEQQKTQITATIKDLETLLASRMQYWFD